MKKIKSRTLKPRRAAAPRVLWGSVLRPTRPRRTLVVAVPEEAEARAEWPTFSKNKPEKVGHPLSIQRVKGLPPAGYVTVTPDYRVEVSRRIKEEFENGHEYYLAHGKLISLPDVSERRPTADFLSWHNQNRFLG